MRGALPFVALALLGAVMVGLLFGDGCGPVERGIRAALGTWDMWQTPRVSAYEQPLHHLPAGTAPVSAETDELSRAARARDALPPPVRRRQARLAWRRFCHHCHGQNGGNRSIVGESFGFELPDLREEEIQEMEDEDLYEIVSEGSGRMLALAATLTPLERLLAIAHLRTLAGKPSRPFFPPRWVEPAQRPPDR